MRLRLDRRWLSPDLTRPLRLLLHRIPLDGLRISERTSHKIKKLATRRKGLWTGGFAPRGYDAVEKKLVVNETEAEQVRGIFHLFIETGGPGHRGAGPPRVEGGVLDLHVPKLRLDRRPLLLELRAIGRNPALLDEVVRQMERELRAGGRSGLASGRPRSLQLGFNINNKPVQSIDWYNPYIRITE